MSWFNSVKEIKVVDPLTVQMNLDAPYPLLGSFAGMRAAGIIPKGLAEKENLKIKGIGTGPFKLVEYVPQDRIVYARHADYWDKPLPYLDGMVFKVLTEENARLAALRAGQIQYAFLSAQGVAQLEGAPGVAIAKSPFAWVVLHYINVLNKPLSDARVRRAMRMAVDTNEVIQKAMFGAGVPSGPVPTGYGDWYLDPKTLPYLKADVEGAKKLLAEAGYANGFKVEIKCSPQYPEFVASTLVIQESLKKIGIEVTATQMEWGAFVAENAKSNRSCGKEGVRHLRLRQYLPPGPRRVPLFLLPLQGRPQQGGLRPAVPEGGRPARRGPAELEPGGAPPALPRSPEGPARGEPELVVVRQVQHRGGLEQGARVLAVVHRSPTLPEEDLAGLTR